MKILNKNICRPTFTNAGITVGKHYPHWLSIYRTEIKNIQSTASLVRVVVIDVSITEGVPADLISADANGKNGGNLIEDVVELPFGDGRIQISHIQRSVRCNRRCLLLLLLNGIRHLRHGFK